MWSGYGPYGMVGMVSNKTTKSEYCVLCQSIVWGGLKGTCVDHGVNQRVQSVANFYFYMMAR